MTAHSRAFRGMQNRAQGGAQDSDAARIKWPARACEQCGLTLVELLVAMALGLFICAAIAALFVSSRNAFALVEDSTRVDDTGRFAIETISHAIRQTGFIDWSTGADPADDIAPAIRGLDARSLKSNSAALENPLPAAVNGSDVLALRFGGAGSGASGDGSLVNCAGFGVGEAAAAAAATGFGGDLAGQRDAQSDRLVGISIFYVAHDRGGEPELRCKYRGKRSWASVAIARGVESFQVLYGVGRGAGSHPARFLTASQVDLLDQQLVLRGADESQRERDRNRRSHWKKISEIRFAVLVRGTQPLRASSTTAFYDLFGADYSARFGATDIGSRVSDAPLHSMQGAPLRRVFAASVRLRNLPAVAALRAAPGTAATAAEAAP